VSYKAKPVGILLYHSSGSNYSRHFDDCYVPIKHLK
jgi:hypothetical protein